MGNRPCIKNGVKNMELLRCEDFYDKLILFNGNEGLYIEYWSGSTKHPDRTEYFSNYIKSDYMEENQNVYLWILKCAVDCNFFFHAKSYIELANMYKEKYMK